MQDIENCKFHFKKEILFFHVKEFLENIHQRNVYVPTKTCLSGTDENSGTTVSHQL